MSCSCACCGKDVCTCRPRCRCDRLMVCIACQRCIYCCPCEPIPLPCKYEPREITVEGQTTWVWFQQTMPCSAAEKSLLPPVIWNKLHGFILGGNKRCYNHKHEAIKDLAGVE